MKHPISKYKNFEDLYSELECMVEQGYINKKTKGDLALYDYSKTCTYERMWNNSTLIARGLVIDEVNKSVVSLPFPKFFNEGGEHNEYGDNLGNFVPDGFFEKMDGSCGIIYFYQGEWRVNTRGSFDSEQAVWAKKYLDDNIDKGCLVKNVTYICEIIYKDNKIVVDYEDEGLTLIGAYDIHSNQEIDIHWIYFKITGFKQPKTYKFNSISDAKFETELFDHNKEGFVYRSRNGVRVKIKGAEYCRVHGLISYHTPLFLWRRFTNDGYDACMETKIDLPEELWEQFDEWLGVFVDNFAKILNDILTEYKNVSSLSPKELGLAINSGKVKSKHSSQFFELLKSDGEYAKLGSKSYKYICSLFEPKNNNIITL